MKLSIAKGATSVLLHVFVQDSSSTTGAGLTGLTFGSAGLVCYRARSDDGNAGGTAVALSGGTRGTWSSGGFVEKDATNLPGVYELGITNASLASGVRSVLVMLKGATNMAPVVLEIELTGWDNQDAVRGGMTALPNAAAGANTGLPVVGTQVPNATAGASGGLLISGSNSGTTTFGALTVTGAFTADLSGSVVSVVNLAYLEDPSVVGSIPSITAAQITSDHGSGSYTTPANLITLGTDYVAGTMTAGLSALGLRQLAKELEGTAGTVWHVATTGNDTTGDGLSWATAYALPSKAASVAAAGDVIKVGPGTFAQAGTRVTLPTGVSMEGAGTDETIITFTGVHGVTPGTRSRVADLTIKGTLTGSSDVQHPISFTPSGAGSGAPTGVVLQRMRTQARSDGLTVSGTSSVACTVEARAEQCSFESDFDCVTLFDSTNVTVLLDLIGCRAYSSGTQQSIAHGLYSEAVATIRATDCDFYAADGVAGDTRAVDIEGVNTRLTLTRCSLRTDPADGPGYDLMNAVAANVIMLDCTFNPAKVAGAVLLEQTPADLWYWQGLTPVAITGAGLVQVDVETMAFDLTGVNGLVAMGNAYALSGYTNANVVAVQQDGSAADGLALFGGMWFIANATVAANFFNFFDNSGLIGSFTIGTLDQAANLVLSALDMTLSDVAPAVWAVATRTLTALGTGIITRATFAADTGLQPIRSAALQVQILAGDTGAPLGSGASATNDFYKGCWLYVADDGIVSGGAPPQCRLITAYNGATKQATVSPAWLVTSNTFATYSILPAGAIDVGLWRNSVPNALISGRVDSNLQAGASGVITSTLFAQSAADRVWSTAARTLTAFAFSVGIAAGAISDASFTLPAEGVHTGPLGWLRRQYRRWFNRVVRDATTIKVYRDDGTTVDATSAYTAGGTTEDVSAAT